MNRKIRIKLLLIVFIFLGLFSISTQNSKSQVAPMFWVTWKAENYSASTFNGKSLPSYGSPITVSFELILDGKVADLKNEEILWYVDGAFVSKSLGMKEYSFRSNIGTGAHSVRIEITKFQKNNTLMKNVQIPVSLPEVVLDSPYSRSNVTSDYIALEAKPYFFNVSQISGLMYDWKVNNVAPTSTAEDPSKIIIAFPKDMPSGSQILVNVGVRNALRRNEKAEAIGLFTTL